jgi:hypothetical protein
MQIDSYYDVLELVINKYAVHSQDLRCHLAVSSIGFLLKELGYFYLFPLLIHRAH